MEKMELAKVAGGACTAAAAVEIKGAV